MAEETYYWIDRSSNFGGGKNSVKYGEEIPKVVSDEKFEENLGSKKPAKCISQSKFDSLLKNKQINKERVATKRELSELESLREQVKAVKGNKSEESKLSADLELANEKIADLEKKSGGDCKECPKLQVRIEELENADPVVDEESQESLNLIKETLSNIQVSDKKEELWDAIKSIKDLFKEDA